MPCGADDLRVADLMRFGRRLIRQVRLQDARIDLEPKQSPEEKRAAVADNLPDKDFGGASFTILGTDTSANSRYVDLIADKETGYVVNDKVYARNTAVASKFNVKLASKAVKADKITETVSASAAASDGAYDLIAADADKLSANAMAGDLVDINTMKGIDLSREWWAQGANSALTVNGKLYMASGDLSATMYDMMYVIFFNQDLIDGNSLKSPVQLYDGDAWTFDRYAELSIAGGRSYTGTVSSKTGFPTSLMAALDMKAVKAGDDGYPTLNFNNKTASSTAAKLTEMFKSKAVGLSASAAAPLYMNKNEDGYEGGFIAGTALFMNGFVADIGSPTFQGLAFNYGFVPLPKYDEYQKSYAQTSYKAYTTAAFAKGVKNAEMSAIITEALAVGGYKDVVLQGIYAAASQHGDKTDSNASSMLNSMRKTFTVDFSVLHNLPMAGLLEAAADGSVTDFAASYKENEASYKDAVKAVVSAYKAIG